MQTGADGLRHAAIALTVLREKGLAPTIQLPAALKFAEEIAEGKLSPLAALTMGGMDRLRALFGLDLEFQDRLAQGEKVKIARLVDGRIVSAEVPVRDMTDTEMRLAFEDGRVTDWQVQGQWLLQNRAKAQAKRAAPVKVRADLDERKIVVGKSRIAVADLAPALAALGFELRPINATLRRSRAA